MQNLIFDNIIFSLQKNGGISVVWHELLSRINNIKDVNITYLNYKFKNNMVVKKIFHVQRKTVFSFLKLLWIRYLPYYTSKKVPFIFHSSYYRICNNPNAINVTTVHDFTYEYYSHGIKRIIHHLQKNIAIKNSAVIICVSNNTRLDLIKFYPHIDKSKIKVIYNGVSNDYYILSNNKTRSICPYKRNDYILFIGSRAIYKNFNLVVMAANITNLNLIIVGNDLNRREIKFLNMNINKNKYYFMGNVPNNTLNQLYNNAFALLYPSNYEGFGIPILEAQRAGCPVIAQNSSSIPEIIGNTPLLMERPTIEEMINKLNLLKNKKIRRMIIDNGINNSRKFSWDKTFEETFNVYKELWRNLK